MALNKFRQKAQERKQELSSQVSETIAAYHDFEAMVKTPGWKRLEKFILSQQTGMNEAMEQEVAKPTIFSIAGMTNTFIRYILFLSERKAYRKIKTFITMTMQKGAEHERQIAEAEAKRAAKADKPR